MEDLNIKDLVPNRESAPFIYDVSTRVIKGAVIGGLVGYLFFSGRTFRRFSFYYGAGFGLGASYS